jgi:hypothetical protein
MTRRVFLSHTSEFAKYPNKRSFVDAAVDAVVRAGCVPCDMKYFTARDQQPDQYCVDRICACDVYIGIIGLRYGSPVRDRPEVSYTELEFETVADKPQIKRFVFLLDELAQVPIGLFSDTSYANRQQVFRKRLQDAGVTCKPFSDFHELEKLIYQALVEEEVSVAPGGRQEPKPIDWPENKSPYPGLLWFDEEYAPLFFGRDREVQALLAKMREPQGRLFVISGASGSGKSSLVNAGLWQAVIKRGQLPGSERWKWKRITPGAGKAGPFVKLAIGLQEAFPQLTEEVDELATLLETNAMALGCRIAMHRTNGHELVLVVDQLEELFTQGYSADTIQAFLAALVTLSGDPEYQIRVVTTIRSDFFGRLAESESVLKQINDGFQYLVPPISPTAWLHVIRGPADATGYAFEEGLVDAILNEVGLGNEAGDLPLVAYALNQLFKQRQNKTFTHAAYRAMDGVAGAIASTADQTIEKLREVGSTSFDRVFSELVHIERDRPPTRKRASLSHFRGDEEATKLIQVLAGRDCRVLVTAGEGPGATVDVAHEKLFSAWKRLKDWIDNSDRDLRLIDFEEECAARWHEKDCRVQSLWSHEQAVDVQRALVRFKKSPSSRLQAFMHPQQTLIERLNDESLSHQDRLLIGQKLAEFGDTRDGVGVKDGLPNIVWIDIPGGSVKLEEVDRVFKVEPFCIAKYQVTNIQFEAFLKAEDGYRNEEWWRDIEHHEAAQPSWQEANSPRETASWYEAVAFCRWLSAKTETSIRLPTEWEWQQAATGGDPERIYPWKGEWDTTRCNSYESRLNRTTAVGMYPQGATRQGALDMAGNVWDWCLNTYEDQDLSITTAGRRVLRGGSWDNAPVTLRVSNRLWNFADYRFNGIGFRLAQDLDPLLFAFSMFPMSERAVVLCKRNWNR